MSRKDRIICPHCGVVNEPGDDETTSYLPKKMECGMCEKEFTVSREIHVQYATWK